MGITHSKVSAAAEGSDPTKVRASDWNDDHVGDYFSGASGSGQIVIPGMAIADRLPSSPDSDNNEFDTNVTNGNAPSGWTITANTPTTMTANGTIPSHLYIARNSVSGDYFSGIYKTRSVAYTVTAKLAEFAPFANYASAGIAICDAAVNNKGVLCGFQYNGSNGGACLTVTRYSTFIPTGGGGATWSSTPFIAAVNLRPPLYLRAVVSAANSITYQYSAGGLIWATMAATEAYLSTATTVMLIASGNGQNVEAAFDWVRFS